MAFDAGSIIGHAKLDTKGWMAGQKQLTASFKLIKTGVIAVGAAIVAGLGASIKVANDFNKEFSNVRTLVDEAKVNTKAMKQELLGLDARLGSSKDLAKGLYQTLSAGVDAANAVKFVGESAKFAKAALTDTNTAVDVLTTALNAYKLSADKVTKVSDIFFQTIKQGKVTGQELASTLGDVIPTASSLGVSLEELGASIATMTKQGVKSAEATTQLNAIMTAFLKPSREMSEALREMGFESGSALIEAEGLTGALDFLQNTTKGNKDELAKLLPNVRAFKGALALTGEQADVYTESLKLMEDATGATDEAFQKQELTFETLRNSVEKLAIRIGDALLPIVYDITTAITNFINSTENIEKIADSVGFLIGGFIVVKDIVVDLGSALKKSLGIVIESLTRNFEKLQKELGTNISFFDILSGTTKILGITLTTVAHVINIVITALADLVIAIKESGETIGKFYEFIRGEATWQEVKDSAAEIGEAFKNLGKNVGEEVGTMVDDIVNEFEKMPTEVQNLSIKMNKNFDKTFTNVSKSIKNGLSIAKQETLDGMEDIQEIIQDGGEEIVKKDWKKIMSDFGAEFKGGLDQALKIAAYFVNTLGDAFGRVSGVVSMAMENQLSVIEMTGEKELANLEEKKESALESENDRYQRELENLQLKVDVGTLTEDEANIRKEQLESEHNARLEEINMTHDQKINDQKEKQRKKENEQKKKMFETQKAFDIANVWIQAASGIIAAWAGSFQALGFIPFVGPALAIAMASVMSGLIIGTAVAQTVLISQQQFVPKAQEGGTVTRSGLIMTDEEGGEIKRYPTGTTIIPHDISREIASNVSNQKRNIVINMAGAFSGAVISSMMDLEKILDKVIEKMSNRLTLRT